MKIITSGIMFAQVNFFDVVIDWCLLDGLDDVANPPSSATSVLANRWLGDNFKETAMTTSVWSYIKGIQ